MPLKRRAEEILTACSPAKVSLEHIEKFLEAFSGDKVNLSRELSDAVSINTPYGPLITQLPLPLESGGDYLWTVCNPFAILYIFCENAEKIADLLCRSLESNGNQLHGSIVLYTDETTHGNVKRHDLENELQGVYWTIPSCRAGSGSGQLVGYILVALKPSHRRG